MEYLTGPQTRQRFGDISDMTLWRWIHDARVGFPKPLVINRRRYFRIADIEAFELRQAAQSACADAAA